MEDSVAALVSLWFDFCKEVLVTLSFFGLDHHLMLLSCYGTREVRLLLYCATAQKFIFGLAISTMLRRKRSIR